MQEIELTQGMVAKVDDEDYDWLNQWKWHVHEGTKTYYARRNIKINGKTRSGVYMHRVIMKASKGVQVDHKSGNGLNCQKDNIRLCTSLQNNRNRKKHPNTTSTSIYKGVHWYKAYNKWQCRIRTGLKQKHLGYFNSEVEAAVAYNQAALKYHGEFARLNNIKDYENA